MNPNSSKHILCFRAFQGHSGRNLVDPALQDNVLLPEDVTEYINHIGNASEMHSIIRGGLIPGGRSLERDRQSVFFTTVNPMDDDQSTEESLCDLDKPRIVPCRNTWMPHQNTVYWCNFKLAQKRGLQFYQTRSHAIVLCNTLPAICIEKAVCMKTEEDLFHKVHQSPRVPRIALKPVDNKINLIKKQENPQTTTAHRKEVTEKPVAVASITGFLTYLFLLSNDKTRIAKKRSES